MSSPDDALLRALIDDPWDIRQMRAVWDTLGWLATADATAWVGERVAWLPDALRGLAGQARRAPSYAVGSETELTLAELCAIRSGIEVLRTELLDRGLADVADDFDLAYWDNVLGDILPGKDEIPVPAGIPPLHWWWRAPVEGRPAPEWIEEDVFRSLAGPRKVAPREVWRALAGVQREGAGAAVAWVAMSRDWLPAVVSELGLLALEALSFAIGEGWTVDYDELCAMRSGLEYLRHGFLLAGLADPDEWFELSDWDDTLEIVAKPGFRDLVAAPGGTPPDHWWWWAQTNGRPARGDFDLFDPDTY